MVKSVPKINLGVLFIDSGQIEDVRAWTKACHTAGQTARKAMARKITSCTFIARSVAAFM
jgi:hypothetical protein